MNNTYLIIGGISSGKTKVALDLANGLDMPKVYMATALNSTEDPEMQAKITAHQHQRGAGWHTVESPLNLAESLQNINMPSVCVIDCVNMWISNIMWHHEATQCEISATSETDVWTYIESYLSPITDLISTTPHTLIFVSSEVGYAPVHGHKVVRHFQRYQGQVNQAVAKSVNSVYLVTAGIATKIK